MLETFLYAFFAFFLSLLISVAFHEYGHFSVARFFGVEVKRFSIGFGKKLFSFKGKSGTEYAFCAIPIGGYVDMLDETYEEVPEEKKHKAYNNRPVLERLLIVFAGPAFNYILAIFLYLIVFSIGSGYMLPVVGDINKNLIIGKSDLQKNDIIVSINGEDITMRSEVAMHLMYASIDQEDTSVVYKRNGVFHKTIIPTSEVDISGKLKIIQEIGWFNYLPTLAPVVDKVIDESPASKYNFQSNDKIISVNGNNIDYWHEFLSVIGDIPNKDASIVIERNGELITINAVIGERNSKGYLGLGVQGYVEARNEFMSSEGVGFLNSFYRGLDQVTFVSVFSLKVMKGIILGDISFSNISSPIGIAVVAGKTLASGVVSFILFLAVLNVALGLFNILPIPTLDGGHMLFQIVEWYKGAPVAHKVMHVAQIVGMLLLIELTLFAVYNDVIDLLESDQQEISN